MASTDETPALILASTPPHEAEVLIESSADLKDTFHPEPLQLREITPIIAPEVAASVPIAAPSAPETETETEPETEPAVEPDRHVVQEFTQRRVEEPVEEPTRELLEEAAAVNLAASIITTPEPFRGEAEETKEETAAGAIETAVPFSVVSQQDAQLSQPSQVSEPMNLGATGLVMIETHPEKIKPAETDAEGEATQLQRRRKRTPPPSAVEQHEPLVQVETHK
jgi:ribonuclease E